MDIERRPDRRSLSFLVFLFFFISKKLSAISNLSLYSLELLESQTGLMQNTPHELREKCLTSLHSALVSNSGHLLKLGLMGVQVTGF